MKFKIRFADQIVGLFIIIALLSLVLVIFMLGSKQRWFAKDYIYRTYFDSATGISDNMPVQYRGFTIGNVKSYQLTDEDEVEVEFSIFDKYNDRVKEGSLVELSVSPIGLGNSFHFHPGIGENQLEEGAMVPDINSPQGQTLIQFGLAKPNVRSDSISNLISRANSLLENLNTVLAQVSEAFDGSEASVLGRTLIELEETVSGISDLVGGGPETELKRILSDAAVIVGNLKGVSSELNDPDGLLYTVLDPDGAIYTNLESSLASVSGMLQSLDKSLEYLPAQMPQIVGLISELRATLKSAEDVLIALSNNPLLRKGIPERVHTESSGTNPRNLSF